MNLLAAGARSCALAIFFSAGMAATQSPATLGASEQSRKAVHRSHGHDAEAVPCKRCSNDNLVAPTPDPPTGSPPPQKTDPKSSVIILEANDRNEISLAAPLGTPLPLTLFVKQSGGSHEQGELLATTFISQGDQQALGASAKIQLSKNPGTTERTVSVDLSKQGATPFEIRLERLRTGKIYKGELILTAGELINQWNVTLTTERGALAVDPIGTLKFVKSPRQNPTGEFFFTIYDKADVGPYHHLRVRFEPPSGTNSKAITSNFSLSKLRFLANGAPIHLARRANHSSGSDEAALTLTKARTLSARIGSLSPGEYSGALHFAADETSDDAAEAKLPLLIQVRHPVWVPVVVILVSSLVGWFGSKFLVGARRSRDLLRQIKALRERAESIRRERPSVGWRFPTESTSLGFARIIVELSLLKKLAQSTIEVVFHGDEIDARLKLAEKRLLGIESLRRTRLDTQPRADGRPAAQQKIGTALRSATNLLDGPIFTDVEEANLTKLLDEIKCWANDESLCKEYQKALIDRLNSDRYPSPSEIKTVPGGSQLYAQLDSLNKTVPTKDDIEKQSDVRELKSIDEKIMWVMVLWREYGHEKAWAEKLATSVNPATNTLNELFDAIDEHGWEALEKQKDNLALTLAWPKGKRPQTYEVVEVKLGFKTPSTFELERLRFHPSQHVKWNISEETRAAKSDAHASIWEKIFFWLKIFRRIHKTSREDETDSFTLVQYFLFAGKVDVTATATLSWISERIKKIIKVDEPLVFSVKSNPEYSKRLWRVLKNWPDFAAIVIAAIFAIATAIGAQYDSTFGGLGQYLAIIIWAAGAAAGGNLFTQLGASSAPGGAATTTK